jgi:hypothetical protein
MNKEKGIEKKRNDQEVSQYSKTEKTEYTKWR